MRMFLISAASAFALLFCSHPQAATSVHTTRATSCLVAAGKYSARTSTASHTKCHVSHSKACHCHSCQC